MKLRRFPLVASLFLSAGLAVANPPAEFKYFNEPGGTDSLGHYDVRYYQGEAVSYEEKGDTLHHMVRAYLNTFREKGVETWIAHGTLLGWWWNGKILPWDWDLDVQVSEPTLIWLGENMNMTMHKYTGTFENGTEFQRDYLLDINPNGVERLRGKGLNVIDARWVDVRNGLFIDITALSETNPSALPGIWSCKNYHRYRTTALYPMRETMFEGVPALVPYSFDRILQEEYTARALTSTYHEEHLWVVETKEWVKAAPQQRVLRGRTIELPTNPRDPKPHIPRSLQAKPRSGLGNLLRLL